MYVRAFDGARVLRNHTLWFHEASGSTYPPLIAAALKARSAASSSFADAAASIEMDMEVHNNSSSKLSDRIAMPVALAPEDDRREVIGVVYC